MIKIITSPKVECIASTVFHGSSLREIPDDGRQADKVCAFAAKGCYDTFGKDGRLNVDNQRSIITSLHGSVLEHFNITLWIEGVSRALSHELVRHRAGFGYSQRSTRYAEEDDAAIVLEPDLAVIQLRRSGGAMISVLEQKLLDEHIESCERSIAAYVHQVKKLMDLNPRDLKGFELRKWARGKARNVLPHALETRVTVTGNLRAWRHFIESRSSRHAEKEIRRLADVVFVVLQAIAPTHFDDYVVEVVDDYPEFTTPNRKV